MSESRELRIIAKQMQDMRIDASCLFNAADRIEKLEAALRMVIDWDNTLDWEEAPAWGDVMDNVSKALEGKDEA